MKTHLSLTAVAYETGDVLAHVLAYCSLIPQALLVIEGSALLLAESTQRRMEAGSILAGQLTNEAINHTLKRVFRHPRPGGMTSRAASSTSPLQARAEKISECHPAIPSSWDSS